MHRSGCFRSSVRNSSFALLLGRSTTTTPRLLLPSPIMPGALSPPRLADSTSLHRHVQVANHWQAVIRRNKIDPKTGQSTFEDWDDVIMGFQQPTLATTGQSLLDRYASIERHVKPKQIRREINANKIYRRSVKRVEDLASYIKFMRSKAKEDDNDA